MVPGLLFAVWTGVFKNSKGVQVLGTMIIPILFVALFLAPGPQSGANLNDAIAFYEKGNFGQAAKLLQKLCDSSPSDPDIRLWLGRSHLKLREWDKGVQEMEAMVRLQPSNARYHLLLGRACGDRASHSSFLTAMGWAKRVVKEFETARTLAPDDVDIRFDLLEYYLEAPGIVGGGKDKAEAEVQAIARLKPEKSGLARATVLIKNKNWDQARKELSQAVINYPQSASACKDLAEFMLDRQDFKGALNFAKKALALDGKSKRSRLIAAAATIRLKTDLDETAKYLQDLVAGSLGDEDPSFEEVYYWLGECWLAKGEKARAQDAFKSALAFNPEYSKAKDSLSKTR
jgi:predicted Zn-dependent protease